MSTDGIFWSRNLCLSVIMLLRTKFRVNQKNRLLAISQRMIIRLMRNFVEKKQNDVLTQVIWPKYQISKIQDGGRPPFWK